MITVDSLRYDHLSIHGYNRKTTPYLEYISKYYKCVDLEMRANAPYTKASFKSIMTGFLPFSYGSYFSVRNYKTIATFFKKLGFKTLGIANNVVLDSRFGYGKGFDLFLVSPSSTLGDKRTTLMNKVIKMKVGSAIFQKVPKLAKTMLYALLTKGRVVKPTFPCEALVKAVQRFIKAVKSDNGKAFVWIHFMETHYPYDVDLEVWEELYGESKINRLKYIEGWISILEKLNKDSEMKKEILKLNIMLYDNAIRIVDKCVEMLVKGLEELGCIDETLLIMLSDHGEEFLEHGAFGHIGRRYFTHIYEELIKVPFLVVDFKDVSPIDSSFVKNFRSIEFAQIDILPTILGFFGVSNLRTDGINFYNVMLSSNPTKYKRVIISEASLINKERGTRPIPVNEKIILAVKKGKWKYILRESLSEELYDLQNDPYERNNVLSNAEDYVLWELRAISKSRLRKIKHWLIKEKTRNILRLIKT